MISITIDIINNMFNSTGDIQMALTIKEQIYNAIWEGITNGEYRPDHVFNEKTLVEKYQVSKSPVRDALIELCSDGILRSIPRYGYEIVRISSKQLWEITRLRLLIESDNLELMMGRFSEVQIAQLKAHTMKTDHMLQNGDLSIRMHWNNNIDFHKLLYSMSNNEFGASLLERCMKSQTMAYSMSCLYAENSNKLLSTTLHWEIIHHIEKNDRDGAINALKSDLESFPSNMF